MRLVLVFGPPAVGKLAVGRELVRQGGFRLAHNHAVLEPLLEVFDYASEPFARLLAEFRARIVEEAAAAGTDLVLTFVWGLDLDEDAEVFAGYLRTYAEAGGEVAVVELYADLETRLARNGTALRLDAKPSKRDVTWSDANVRELDVHRLSTQPGVEGPGERAIAAYPCLRIDNTDLSAELTAARVLQWLGADHPLRLKVHPFGLLIAQCGRAVLATLVREPLARAVGHRMDAATTTLPRPATG